uniref:Uncharacterized protein n=1 Tax=Panagrolaimus sp. PS1159 TaxID=55785 RepID=A0AC35EUK4_9BILA
MGTQSAGDATQSIVTFPHLSPFVLDPTKPNRATSWMEQAERKFELSPKMTDKQKVIVVASALDSDTFDRVSRALLPDKITTL